MPVRSPTWHEPEEFAQRCQSFHVLRHVPWVTNLDTVEPHLYERMQSLTPAFDSRVSPDHDGARCMREIDRLLHFEPGFRNEAGSSRGEIAIERFAVVAHMPAANERTCYMRPSDRATRSLFHYGLKRYVDTDAPKLVDDRCCARLPRFAEAGKAVFDQ